MLAGMTSIRAASESVIARVATIGADPMDDDERRRRKALVVVIAVLILPIAAVWGSLYLALGATAGLIAYLYFVVSVAAVVVFARTRDPEAFLRIELVDILLAPTVSQFFVGGFVSSGGVGLWGILAPLGALVFWGVREGARWFAAFVVVFLVSGVLGEVTGGFSDLPAWFESTMIALNVTVGGTIVFTLLALFAHQRQEALAALRVEQDKAENLLLNILPRSIADKLKADTATIADQFEAASILFADVVDFTPLSERLPPAEVVGILDHLFTHFDDLAERFDLEKIKTIGDCYMVAAGVPTPRPDHAQAVALMALEMREAMRSEDGVGHLGLELRIGINSGPVVAGVIGRKRFLYDLWGDAVNTASRMESQGTAGRIQVTRATYELLKDAFVLEPRGSVAIKGKGEIDTWYLVGRRAPTTEDVVTSAAAAVAPAAADLARIGPATGTVLNGPTEQPTVGSI
jgi:adenylate cyclase